MSRYKTFDATGIATSGRLYAGDLNAIQDRYADKSDFAQTLDLQTLRIGDTSIQLTKYGDGEARLTSALRLDGVLRGLGGILPGAFTTAQRDSIASGFAPYGVAILNSEVNRWEWNKGTDVSRNWQALGGGAVPGLRAARPSPSAMQGQFYFATDQVALYFSDGATWTRIGPPPGDISITFSASPDPGYTLCQGQTITNTGPYVDLYARYGATIPDLRGRVAVGQSPGGKPEVDTVGDNDGRAVNLRNISHMHWTYLLEGQVSGPSAGATVIRDYNNPTTGDANNKDYPAYLVVNYQAKL